MPSLSIKVRCASWQQLATLYKRDLSRGAMFLKASSPPAVGTEIKIDLELPSGSIIELLGKISSQVDDPQRGKGVELKLEPLATKSVWLIESALAAETKVRLGTAPGVPVSVQPAPSGPTAELADTDGVIEAETELVRALEAEVESLKKLNPFLVLGVGYETTDDTVRQAFGELTKRYHPDRFARYQSTRLKQFAAEIFILIRDAYRKLADSAGRAQALAQIAKPKFMRVDTQPRGIPPGGKPRAADGAASPKPPVVAVPARAKSPAPPAKTDAHEAPTNPGAHEKPTNPSMASAQLAQSELAQQPRRPDSNDDLAIPVAPTDAPKGVVRESMPTIRKPTPPTGTAATADAADDSSAADALIDAGKLDEALTAYRGLARKHPADRALRAGVELCEGLKALHARDRLEAAQRFESALELDPSNERAARELADMRRQATNERKGLLSRLMGKKEPGT